MDSADPAGALLHFTAVRDAIGDRGPFPLLTRCLSGRSGTLLGMGRIAEAAGDARRALALAREGGYPVAEALALSVLSLVACVSGDRVGAVQLATQAERISASQHGPSARVCCHTLTSVLIEVGDLAADGSISNAVQQDVRAISPSVLTLPGTSASTGVNELVISGSWSSATKHVSLSAVRRST